MCILPNMDAAKSLSDKAHERASWYAPMPKYEPIQAGLLGAVVAAVSAMVGLTFANVPSDDLDQAAGLTAIIGFFAPYLYLKNQERLHYKAWSREYEKLRERT